MAAFLLGKHLPLQVATLTNIVLIFHFSLAAGVARRREVCSPFTHIEALPCGVI